MILSSAPPRHTRSFAERAQGALLALLVQAAFVAMLLLSSQHSPPLRNPARETILLLHPTPQTAPGQIDARGPAQPRIAPIPIPTAPNIAPSPDIAPPSGIAGFGRSLFGCAPEHYADLLPDERAHCPKPGEGMAVNQPPDLLAPPKSHSKDEAIWQEQWAEDHWVPPICPLGPPGAVARCVLEQSIAENRRREAAWARIAEQQAQDLKPKPPPVPIPFRRGGK
jgi:hypothetical protein